jgi:hypothetical protein
MYLRPSRSLWGARGARCGHVAAHKRGRRSTPVGAGGRRANRRGKGLTRAAVPPCCMLHFGCALRQLGKVPCARADERVVLRWRLRRCEQKPRRTQADTCAPFALSLRIPRAKARGAWEPGRHTAKTAKAAKHLRTCVIGGGRDPHAQWERLDQPLVRLHIQRTSAGQHLSACVLALVPSHCRLQTTGAEPAFWASPNHQNVRIYRRARPVCLASHCVQRLMAVPTRNSEGLLRRSASVLCFADHCEGSRVVCAPGLDGIRGGGGRRLPSG